MPNDSQQAAQPTPTDADGPTGVLRRIPLAARMLLYGASFLAVVLVGLPWVAYRLDIFVPAVHVELGWGRLVGAAIFFVCLSIYIRASYVLATRGRGAFVEFDRPAEFVATGPYRWVRNPIAASLIGALLGEAVALSSTGVFLMLPGALLIGHLQVVFLEEPLLRRRFGQRYVEYLARVPRWIPRPPAKEAP